MPACAKKSSVFKKKVFEYNDHGIRKGADLSGADLSGLEGREVVDLLDTLDGVNFAGANLTGANFDGLELSAVNFTGANLTGASLIDCKLPRFFSKANLTNANIRADRKDSDYIVRGGTQGADFKGANLDGASLGGRFYEADFSKANFKGCRLEQSFFNRCSFVDADFSRAHFEGSATFPPEGSEISFHDSNLTNARFVDVSGCAYFSKSEGDKSINSTVRFKVLDGVLYIDPAYVDYDPSQRYFTKIGGEIFVALTPQGFIRAAVVSTSYSDDEARLAEGKKGYSKKLIDSTSAYSGVETKLAEVTELLSKGLIDQAEHDALRRKILGI